MQKVMLVGLVLTAKDGGETEAASPQEATDDGEAAAPATDAEGGRTSPAGDAAEFEGWRGRG